MTSDRVSPGTPGLLAVASRPGGESDEIVGVRPAAVFKPASSAEAEAAMVAAAHDRLAIAFAGGRTAMAVGAPPRRLDAVLETRGLARILEHAPADQIVVAEAGMTLGELQRALSPHGQRLALDPPHPERATLGGIVASSAFGPLRTRYGSVRDLLIGVSFVRADGVAARAGGKVVKNVAGFDVCKLLAGSFGTLALVTGVTFRLHPLPEKAATVLWPGRSAADVAAIARRLGDAALEPAAVWATASGEAWDVAVRFEGFAAGVAQQTERLLARLEESAVADGAAEVAAAASHDRARSDAPVAVKLAAPRGAFERLAPAAFAPLSRALDGATGTWYPTLGLGFVAGGAVSAPSVAAVAAAILEARAAAEAAGGSAVLLSAPAEVRARVDVWGRPPDAFPLMRALKERFDPEGRLAPGRFVGGL